MIGSWWCKAKQTHIKSTVCELMCGPCTGSGPFPVHAEEKWSSLFQNTPHTSHLFTSTAAFWETLNWVRQSRGIWSDSESTSETEEGKKKKTEAWLELRLAPTALAETDVCLCSVVVLNKHRLTRACTYICSCRGRLLLFLLVRHKFWGLKDFGCTYALFMLQGFLWSDLNLYRRAPFDPPSPTKICI